MANRQDRLTILLVLVALVLGMSTACMSESSSDDTTSTVAASDTGSEDTGSEDTGSEDSGLSSGPTISEQSREPVFAARQSFSLNFNVSDTERIESVTLSYRVTGDENFNEQAAGFVVGEHYKVHLPADSMREPSLDYYLTAINAQGTATVYPSSGYALLYLDGSAPVVSVMAHDPVEVTLDNMSQVTFTAVVADKPDTNHLGVRSATLFFRKTGDSAYKDSIAVFDSAMVKWNATLNNQITDAGLDYYWVAGDSANYSTTAVAAVVVDLSADNVAPQAADFQPLAPYGHSTGQGWSVVLKDPNSGVDISTLVVTVAGEEYTPAAPSVSNRTLDTTSLSDGYLVEFTVNAGGEWGLGSQVAPQINVSDRKGNLLQADSFSYYITPGYDSTWDWTEDTEQLISPADAEVGQEAAYVFGAPAVVYHDGLYRMWYASAQPATPLMLTRNTAINYATSSNGTDWELSSEPVVTVDGLASDNHSKLGFSYENGATVPGLLFSPDAIYDHKAKNYKLYFSTILVDPLSDVFNTLPNFERNPDDDIDTTAMNAIAVAVSQNGREWEIADVALRPNRADTSGEPCGGANDCGENGKERQGATAVMMPSVLLDGDTYKMWYVGVSYEQEWDIPDLRSSIRYRIAYAESTDGLNWEREYDNTVMIHGFDSSLYDASGIYEPTVVKDGDTYKMWFHAQTTDHLEPNNRAYDIFYAESEDGLTWNQVINTPAIERNAGNSNLGGARAPEVIIKEGGYQMWYNSIPGLPDELSESIVGLSRATVGPAK